MEMSAQLYAPVTSLPGKETPVPIEQEAGWAPESVTKIKISAPVGNGTPVIHFYRLLRKMVSSSLNNFLPPPVTSPFKYKYSPHHPALKHLPSLFLIVRDQVPHAF